MPKHNSLTTDVLSWKGSHEMLTQLQIQAWICIVFILAFVIANEWIQLRLRLRIRIRLRMCINVYIYLLKMVSAHLCNAMHCWCLSVSRTRTTSYHHRFRDSFIWFWFCLVILSFVRRQSVLYGKEKQKKHTAQICKDNCHSLTRPRTYLKSSVQTKSHSNSNRNTARVGETKEGR